MRELGKPAKGPEVVRVHVPFSIRKRGGRKLVLVPGGAETVPERVRVDNAMIKALARAFPLAQAPGDRRLGTIEDLAAAEKINSSYVSRVLRMTLLAPDIVEAVLNGKHSPETTLTTLTSPFPNEWAHQRSLWQQMSNDDWDRERFRSSGAT